MAAFQQPNVQLHNPYGDLFSGGQDRMLAMWKRQQEMYAQNAQNALAERQIGLQEKQLGMQAEAQKRADRKERYTAIDQARKLYAAGDVQGAKALLQAAGIDNITAEDVNEPDAPAQAPGGPAPQGGSPVPDGLEFRQGNLATPEQIQAAVDQGNAVKASAGFMGGLVAPGIDRAISTPPPMPGPELHEVAGQRPAGQPEGPETMQPSFMSQPPGKFVGQRLRFRAGDEDVMFDPIEARRQQQLQLQQRSEQMRGAFGDEQMATKAAQLAAAGVPQDLIVKALLDEQEKARALQERRTDREGEHAFILERDKTQNAEALKRAYAIASQRGSNPAQEAAAAGTVLGGIRGDIKAFQDANAYDKVTAELNSSDAALTAIKSGNEKAIQNALFGYGKSTAGVGSFTASEQDAILNRTGGTWNQIAQKIGLALNGTYDPEILKVFEQAMQVKRESALGQLKSMQGAYNEKFRKGMAYQNVAQNVADEERGMFGRWLPVEAAPTGAGGVSYGTPSNVKEARNPKVRAYQEEQKRKAEAVKRGKVLPAIESITDQVMKGAGL